MRQVQDMMITTSDVEGRMETRRVLRTFVRSMAAPAPLGNPKWGPKQADHPSIGHACAACGVGFVAGGYTTPAILGPGVDEEERKRAAAGRPYNAVCVEIHWSCAGGGK